MASNEPIYRHWSAQYLIDLQCRAHKWRRKEAEGDRQKKKKKKEERVELKGKKDKNSRQLTIKHSCAPFTGIGQVCGFENAKFTLQDVSLYFPLFNSFLDTVDKSPSSKAHGHSAPWAAITKHDLLKDAIQELTAASQTLEKSLTGKYPAVERATAKESRHSSAVLHSSSLNPVS